MRFKRSALVGLVLALPAFLVHFTFNGRASEQRSHRSSQQSYYSARPLPEPVVFVDGIVSTGDDESHPAFTPDGRTLFFLKNTPSFDFWTIVISRFDGHRWTMPRVAPFSGQYSDADPFVTADGSKFFFISTRPTDQKAKRDTDIWMMERSAEGWSEPHHLGSSVNSDQSEWFPTLTLDGTLYFGSSRSGGKGGTDLYRCRFVNGKYSEPENLGEPINSNANEVEPFISPDEKFVIFAASGRPDSIGLFDLYISYRQGEGWSSPVNLGPPVNSEAWDFSPKITPDSRYFFFTSSRGRGSSPREKRLSYDELVKVIRSPRNGLRDIYQVDISALHLKH